MTELFSSRVDILDNPTAGRIGFVARLAGKKARQKYLQTLVEGPQAVAELLAYCPAAVRDVYVNLELAGTTLQELTRAARQVTDFVHPCTAATMAALSRDAKGICAVANLEQLPVYDLDSKPEISDGMSALLARVQDPGNVGAIIRAADAFGAQQVLLATGSADPLSPKVIRATAGSIFHLPVITGQFNDLAAALKQNSYELWGTSGYAAQSTTDLIAHSPTSFRENICWVFGNEASGLAEDESQSCDHLLKIPLYGRAESLNVAAAAAIVLSRSAELRH